MFDQLEIPHKIFQNWIVLHMLGIRDCVPSSPAKTGPFINYYFMLSNTRRSYSSRETLWAGKGLYMLTLISVIYSNIVHHFNDEY